MTALVYLDDDLFVFTSPNWPGFTYSFYVTEARPASYWLEHMARESWVTDKHLEEFLLVAEKQETGFVRKGFQEWQERKEKIKAARISAVVAA